MESRRRSAGRCIQEEEGRTVASCIVEVGNTEVDIEDLKVLQVLQVLDQEIGVEKAVGKLWQAVYTVLVRRIHSPHLVYLYREFVEWRKANRSGIRYQPSCIRKSS